MSTQPESLTIADELESSIHETHWNVQQAVDELRRLHEVNQELVEALQLAIDSHGYLLMSDPPQDAWKAHEVESKARAALTKARRTE